MGNRSINDLGCLRDDHAALVKHVNYMLKQRIQDTKVNVCYNFNPVNKASVKKKGVRDMISWDYRLSASYSFSKLPIKQRRDVRVGGPVLIPAVGS